MAVKEKLNQKQLAEKGLLKIMQKAIDHVERNKKLFSNSLMANELKSFAIRHLGNAEKLNNPKARVVESKPEKQQRVIRHTPESFNITQKKNTQEVVVGDDYEKMNIDQLKEYAFKKYGLKTVGMSKEKIVLLIQHTINSKLGEVEDDAGFEEENEVEIVADKKNDSENFDDEDEDFSDNDPTEKELIDMVHPPKKIITEDAGTEVEDGTIDIKETTVETVINPD